MSEKRTHDHLLISREAYRAVLAQLDSAADQIREMQEEIKLRTRAGRELEDQVRGDRQTMDAAIAAIDDGVIGSARMLLVMAHPAKHQPKDNGAGDADQESSALSG